MTVYIEQPARNLREELAAAARPSNVKTIGGRFLFGTGDLLAAITAGGVIYLNAAGAPTTSSALTYNGSSMGVGIAPLTRLHVGGTGAIEHRVETTDASNVGTRYKRNGSDIGLIGNAAFAVTAGGATDFGVAATGTLILGAGSARRMSLETGDKAVIGTAASVALFGPTLMVGNASQTGTIAVPGGYMFSNSYDLKFSSGNGSAADGAFVFSGAFSGTQRAKIHPSGGVSINNNTDPGAGNLSVTGRISATVSIRKPSYTVATVPSASAEGAGAEIYVTNESGGATGAESDGTNWRRYADRAIIS